MGFKYSLALVPKLVALIVASATVLPDPLLGANLVGCFSKIEGVEGRGKQRRYRKSSGWLFLHFG
jgi:hypothetical protein